jgi:hypothetical protein
MGSSSVPTEANTRTTMVIQNRHVVMRRAEKRPQKGQPKIKRKKIATPVYAEKLHGSKLKLSDGYTLADLIETDSPLSKSPSEEVRALLSALLISPMNRAPQVTSSTLAGLGLGVAIEVLMEGTSV